jgi:F0F1-type ATP synthase membrane subunit c/vacuolar-type H+-ATPase subunit K
MQNEKINPEAAYGTILTIWAALLMSQFMFLVIVFFAKPELFKFDFTKPLLGENAVIIIALAAVSLADLVISIVIRKKFVERSVTQQNIGLVQTGMIVGCALAEAISLFGLLLAFVFDYQYFFLFSIFGIIGIVLHFPKRDDVHPASFKAPH